MGRDAVIPAVVVSAQTPGLAVIRGLGAMGVPVSAVYYDATDIGYVSRYVARRVFVPDPEDEPDAFIDALRGHCDQLGKAVVYPTDDLTLKLIAQRKHSFSPSTIVACPDMSVVERVIDKHHTYTLCQQLGIPAPKSYAVETHEDLRSRAREIGYPVVLKPRESHLYADVFGKKMALADTWEELVVEFTKCQDAGIQMLLQDFIPGDEARGVNYNAYIAEGADPLEFTAEKICLSDPDFGPPCAVVSHHIPDILEPGRRLLRALGFRGFACTEFKRDERDGVYKLMEVNARHNRSAMLALRCGINFPYIEYNHRVNGELPTQIDYKDGIYWTDSISYLGRVVRYPDHLVADFLRCVRRCVRAHVDATFDWRDSRPFMKRVFGRLKP